VLDGYVYGLNDMAISLSLPAIPEANFISCCSRSWSVRAWRQNGRPRHALLPSRLPPAIAHASANETLSARLARCRRQGDFILFRLRFHLVEGMRYLWESNRWQQYVNGRDP
jgi:hypothetical protein